MIERILAFILTVITLPILSGALLCIILFHGQNPIFKQIRIGKDRRSFTILKIKTMKNGKVTLFGKILRKSGVDEITQFLNILNGQMSFVGPRPLTQQDIDRLGWQNEKYNFRWKVKPGITGLAQLSPICSAQNTIQNDEYYVNNKSIRLDLKIIINSLIIPFIGKKKSQQIINITQS